MVVNESWIRNFNKGILTSFMCFRSYTKEDIHLVTKLILKRRKKEKKNCRSLLLLKLWLWQNICSSRSILYSQGWDSGFCKFSIYFSISIWAQHLYTFLYLEKNHKFHSQEEKLHSVHAYDILQPSKKWSPIIKA